MQGGEIIIILLVALVVFGPTRLPEMARKLGEWTAELRSAARDLRRGLESEVADLKQVADEFKSPLGELKKTSEQLRREIEDVGVSRLDWEGPRPSSGPTPEDAMADLDEIETEAGVKPHSGPTPGELMAELEEEARSAEEEGDS